MPVLPTVTLYGRRGCSLCSAAEADLRTLAPRLRFALETVDIESSDELLSHYMFEIPVVALDGAVLLTAGFSANRLRDVLEEALPAQSRK